MLPELISRRKSWNTNQLARLPGLFQHRIDPRDVRFPLGAVFAASTNAAISVLRLLPEQEPIVRARTEQIQWNPLPFSADSAFNNRLGNPPAFFTGLIFSSEVAIMTLSRVFFDATAFYRTAPNLTEKILMDQPSSRSTRRDFLRQSVATTAATSAAVSLLLASDSPAFADPTKPTTTQPERKNRMSRVKGTQTEKNLLKAFAGESQARNRYTFFADKASEEGFEHIAAIFRETADQERVHALQFFQYLDGGGPLEITATFPAGSILTTEQNLVEAAAGEHEEWESLYPGFSKVAKEEGFMEISRTFNAVIVSEKQHEKRYLALLEHLRKGDLFTREGVVWRCRHCGYISSAPSAPGVCPACKMPQSWFEILAENW